MSSDPITSHVTRARIALLLLGILYAWAAYDNYVHLKPWRDGSLFATPPTGELGRLIDLTYFAMVCTGVAGVAYVALAAIAGKKTTFAIFTALGIFAAHTALRIYQTDGGYLATALWWVSATVLGISIQAAYKANQLRKSRLATARVFA